MNDLGSLIEQLGLPTAIAVGMLWMIWRAGRALGGALLARAAAWFDTQIELGSSLIERNRVEKVSTDRLQRGIDSVRIAGVEFCNLALASNKCEQLGLDPDDVARIRERLINNTSANSAILSALAASTRKR